MALNKQVLVVLILLVSSVSAETISLKPEKMILDEQTYTSTLSDPNLDYDVYLQDKLGSSSDVAIVYGSYVLRQELISFTAELEDKTYVLRLYDGVKEANLSSVKFSQIFGPDVDLDIEYNPGYYKEIYTLKAQPFTAEQEELMSSKIGLTYKLIGEGIKDRLELKYDKDDSLYWYGDGRILWRMLEPYAVDSDNVRVNLTYEVTDMEDYYLMRVILPSEWFVKAKYPITIDPSWITPSSIVNYSSGGSTINNLIDGNIATYWKENDVTYGWFVVADLGATYNVTQFSLYHYNGNADGYPCSVTVVKVCSNQYCNLGEANIGGANIANDLAWQDFDVTDTWGRYLYIAGYERQYDHQCTSDSALMQQGLLELNVSVETTTTTTTTLAPAIVSNLPHNAALYNITSNIVYNFTATGRFAAPNNATLRIYNSSGNVWGSNFTNTVNNATPTYVSYVMGVAGTFIWNVTVYDKNNVLNTTVNRVIYITSYPPPLAPTVYHPHYNDVFSSGSIVPVGYTIASSNLSITYYNLSLFDTSHVFQSFIGTQSNNDSYSWGTTGISNGNYIVGVRGIDSANQNGIWGYSENFSIGTTTTSTSTTTTTTVSTSTTTSVSTSTTLSQAHSDVYTGLWLIVPWHFWTSYLPQPFTFLPVVVFAVLALGMAYYKTRTIIIPAILVLVLLTSVGGVIWAYFGIVGLLILGIVVFAIIVAYMKVFW